MADQIPDDEKRQLQGMIDTLKFVDPFVKKKGFYCVACIHIAIDNCIANCGEAFCNACFTRHYNKRCLSCNKLISEKLDEAKLDFDKGVFKLKVECYFKNNGCKEIMQLGEFNEHRKKCNFSTDSLLPKLYKDKPCDNSEELIEDVHQVKDKVTELETNLSQLKLSEIEKFKTEVENLARKIELQASTMERKFREKEVNHKDEIQKIKLQHDIQFSEMKSQLNNELTLLRNELKDDISESCSYIYICKIFDIGKHLAQWNNGLSSKITSSDFIIKSHDLKFKAIFGISTDDNVIIRIEIIKIARLQTICNVGMFKHSRKYILLDQSENKGNYNVVVLDELNFKKDLSQDINKSFVKWLPLVPLHKLQVGSPYIKNDCIIIKIIFEPIEFSLKSAVSNNGSLLWRIDNYFEKKQNEIAGTSQKLLSKSFYTSQMGYRMHFSLYLNGNLDSKEKYLSIYLEDLLGEWDSFLDYPFTCKATISILDQSESLRKSHLSKSFEKEFNESLHTWGFAQFASIGEIESSTYLKNNCILLKTVVEIL